MVKRIIEFLISSVTATVTWFALSYIFFPIKLSTPADVYFKATMTHMIPLKVFITLVFVLLALFIYEQRIKKR